MYPAPLGGPPNVDPVSFTSVLGVICTVLAFAFVWPQVYRVFRLRSVEGLAPASSLQAIVGSCLWITYAIHKGNAPLLVSNLAVGIGFSLVAIALIRHRVMPTWHLLGVIGFFTAYGTIGVLINPAITGWTATAIGGTSVVPQTIKVLRSTELVGVSLMMYLMLVLTAIGWGTYSFLIHDVVMAGPNFIVGPCSAIVAAKAWAARRTPAPALAR